MRGGRRKGCTSSAAPIPASVLREACQSSKGTRPGGGHFRHGRSAEDQLCSGGRARAARNTVIARGMRRGPARPHEHQGRLRARLRRAADSVGRDHPPHEERRHRAAVEHGRQDQALFRTPRWVSRRWQASASASSWARGSCARPSRAPSPTASSSSRARSSRRRCRWPTGSTSRTPPRLRRSSHSGTIDFG